MQVTSDCDPHELTESVLPSDVGPSTIVHFLSTSNIWPLYVLAVTNFWLYFVLVLLLFMFCLQNPTFVLIKSTICPNCPHKVQYMSSSLTHFWVKCEATNMKGQKLVKVKTR